MLMFIAQVALGVLGIDLTILFVWVGFVAYAQMVDTYREIFKNPQAREELKDYERNDEE